MNNLYAIRRHVRLLLKPVVSLVAVSFFLCCVGIPDMSAQGDTNAQWKVIDVQLPFHPLYSRFRPSQTFVPFFRDPQNGYSYWESFDGDTAGVGWYSTSDGGQTWERLHRSVPIPHDLAGNFGLAPDGRRTTDGGLTWTSFSVGSENIRQLVYDGLSAGGFPLRMAGLTGTPRRLAFTTDGGTTWIYADTLVMRKDWRDTTRLISVLRDTTLFGIIPVDPTTGQFRWESLLGMKGDTLFVTTRGVTAGELPVRSDQFWAIDLRTRMVRHWGMDSLDRFALGNLRRTPEGMLYGWNYPQSAQTYFVRSIDDGRTWDSTLGLSWADFSFFRFLSPTYGISSNARTTDGGRTWSEWNAGGIVNTFFAFDSLHLFATDARTFRRSTDGGNSWVTSGNFWTLTDIDAIHAWNKHVVVGGGVGNLLISTDSAETWSNRRDVPGALPNGFNRLRAVAAPDKLNDPDRVIGLAACVAADQETQSACMIESTDGGLSWTIVAQLPEFDSTIQGEWSMQFVRNGESEGVTGFLQGGNPRALYRSTDGGRSWEFLTEEILTLLAMADDRYGVAGREGALLRTTDGGATWRVTRTYTAPLRFTHGLTAFDRDRYAGILPNNLQVPSEWRAIHSSDGGDSWSLLRGLTYDHNDPDFLYWRSPREVYSLSQIGLLYSSDSGKRFTRFRSVLRWNENMMVASDGSYLYQFSADSARVGRWRIQDFASSVESDEGDASGQFALLDIHVRDVVRIRYRADGVVSVTGGLYDVWGREAVRIPPEQLAGEGIHELNVADLASGHYLLRLSVDGREIVRSVQVVR